MNEGTSVPLPAVDVIVSTYNEAAHISSCLDAILSQDYPKAMMTVWLVDGGSSDQTVAKAREWARRDSRVRVLAGGGRLNLPEALNLAGGQSSAPVVAKIDAHGHPEKTFLRRAVAALGTDEAVACAGGRPIQYGKTRFGQALALARQSRLGVGGSEYAGKAERQVVATVQCGVYRRAALDAVGWFDPAMNFGEDDELNWRITSAGYQILLDTAIRFHYLTRSTWSGAFHQYRNYGRARVMVIRKHPTFLRVYHLVPAAFVATLIILALGTAVSALAGYAALLVAGAYLAALTLESIRQAGFRASRVCRLIAAFSALHLGYGVGMIYGAIAALRDRGSWRPTRAALTRSS